MKYLLLILSIAGVTYGATMSRSSKEDDLKVLAVNAHPVLGISIKEAVIEDPQTLYGSPDDLDWQCLWENRETVYECAKQTSENEKTLCLVKIYIQCQKSNYESLGGKNNE